MIGQARFHRRSNAERFVDTAEVVIGEVQCDGCFKVAQFFAESVRQPRESTDRHPHGEVVAFYKTSRDVIRVRASVNDLGYNLADSWWGVPRFGRIELPVVAK